MRRLLSLIAFVSLAARAQNGAQAGTQTGARLLFSPPM